MDEDGQICCTCLSRDRKMWKVKSLEALLLELKFESQLQGAICWECRRVLQKYSMFKKQAHLAQELLTNSGLIRNLKSLSALRITKRKYYNLHSDPESNVHLTSVETGPIFIKQEINTGNHDYGVATSTKTTTTCDDIIFVPDDSCSDERLCEAVDDMLENTTATLPDTSELERESILATNETLQQPKLKENTTIDSDDNKNIPDQVFISATNITQQENNETNIIEVSCNDTESRSEHVVTATTNLNNPSISASNENTLNSESLHATKITTEDNITKNTEKVVLDNLTESRLRTSQEIEVDTVGKSRLPATVSTELNEIDCSETIKQIDALLTDDLPVSRVEDFEKSSTLDGVISPDVETGSDLPRITSVASLTDCSNDLLKQNDNTTEIELNIPMPVANSGGGSLKTNNSVDTGGKDRFNKNQEAIIVRVVYKGILRACPVPSVKIKVEPVSDHEDYIADPECSMDATVNTSVNTSTTPIDIDSVAHKTWKRSIMLIYDSLRSHKYGARFYQPITDATAPSYSRVVKRPMYLSTIRKNIVGNVLRSTKEVQRDVLLMLTNAIMYNSSNHPVHDMAKDLLKDATTQLGMFIAVQENANDSTTMSRPRRNIETKLLTPKIETVNSRTQKRKPETIKRTRKTRQTIKTEKMTPKIEKDDMVTEADKRKARDFFAIVEKVAAEIENMEPSRSRASKHGYRKAVKKEKELEYETGTKPKDVKSEPIKNIGIKTEPMGEVYKRATRKRRCGKRPVYLDEFDVQVSPKKRERRNNVEVKKEVVETAEIEDLSVAVLTSTGKDMSRNQACYVKDMLQKKIFKLALNSKGDAPMFKEEPIIADGIIKLWCVDENTVEWLKKTVAAIHKKQGQFVVRKQKELPAKVKAGIMVPGNIESHVILTVLKAQNPWAKVDFWLLYSAEQRGENTLLVLGIPSNFIPVLIQRNRRLSYSLGSVYVKFFNAGGKLIDFPPKK